MIMIVKVISTRFDVYWHSCTCMFKKRKSTSRDGRQDGSRLGYFSTVGSVHRTVRDGVECRHVNGGRLSGKVPVKSTICDTVSVGSTELLR